ncbi:MAG TPA: hypothetical protein PKB15_02660 [Acidimicrobiia bacterium]|jgi:hypothetical protein|nr:hypothetical protein [Acidimicrobiia bacterium]
MKSGLLSLPLRRVVVVKMMRSVGAYILKGGALICLSKKDKSRTPAGVRTNTG